MNGSQTGSTRGWSVWMASAQDIQIGSAWAWRTWCDGETRDGAAHSKAEAAQDAQAELERMVAARADPFVPASSPRALGESGKATP